VSVVSCTNARERERDRWRAIDSIVSSRQSRQPVVYEELDDDDDDDDVLLLMMMVMQCAGDACARMCVSRAVGRLGLRRYLPRGSEPMGRRRAASHRRRVVIANHRAATTWCDARKARRAGGFTQHNGEATGTVSSGGRRTTTLERESERVRDSQRLRARIDMRQQRTRKRCNGLGANPNGESHPNQMGRWSQTRNES